MAQTQEEMNARFEAEAQPMQACRERGLAVVSLPRSGWVGLGPDDCAERLGKALWDLEAERRCVAALVQELAPHRARARRRAARRSRALALLAALGFRRGAPADA